MANDMPKLPFVSYSASIGHARSSSPVISHTLTFPSCALAARCVPSAVSATAHNSPIAFLLSLIVPPACHVSPSLSNRHIFTSPPNPALATTRPLAAAERWCVPSSCAFSIVWTSGYSEFAVEWIFSAEAPEPEKRYFGVAATAKISDGCAASAV